MVDVDPIAYSAAIIKQKRAQAIASGKAVAQASTAAPSKTPKKELVLTDLPTGKNPASVISKRDAYLKSINAADMKEAAKANGLDINFGLKPQGQKWLEENPDVREQLDKITKTMAELKASRALTAQLEETLNV